MSNPGKILSILWACCLLLSCKKENSGVNTGAEDVLAQYYDRKFKFKDLTDNLPEGLNGQDSIQFINSCIDRWLKDQILIRDASQDLKELAEIEELTQKYRDELLLLKYEEKLLAEKLDTLIQDTELLKYYNSNKSNYKLESTIFRFVMVKANKPVVDSRKLDQWWNSGLSQASLQSLSRYCENNAEVCFLNPSRWYKWEEIKPHFPSKFIQEKTIQAGMRRDFADFNHSFKIHFLEVVRPNEDPPFSFIRDQARNAILHQRKIKLMESYKAERYEKELREKNIQITNK